ncbi:MAG TPA: hypothetical protein VK066_11310 [Chloroflexota bacterium]|nr:hypothetical protein [Chloroflexota bacterium]
MAKGNLNGLRAPRRRADYTEAERQFSQVLFQRVQDVLEGRCDHLDLLRKYHADPNRLGVMSLPRSIPPAQLRLAVVEELTWQAIQFVTADPAGGPIAQTVTPTGSISEVQEFTTSYPHIVLQRLDDYEADSPDPSESVWRLKRVQNQRRQTQINRLLDATNLLFELVRLVR